MSVQQNQDDSRVTGDGGPARSSAPVRSQELLAVRRRWFRSFPEGPLEFVAAARLVWILALFAAPVLGGLLRTYAAFGIALLLLADVGLTMRWLTGLAGDRDCWLHGKPIPDEPIGRADLRPTVSVILAQGFLLGFGLSFLPLPFETARVHPGAVVVGRWVALAAFCVAIPFIVATCRAAGLGNRWSVVLLAVPFLAWWPVRRLAGEIGASLAEQAARQSHKDLGFSRVGFVFADAMWVVMVLVLVVDLAVGGIWTRATFQGLCSGLVVAVAAIADVAAMESAHHAYLMYLRTASQPARS
jgi:hypothetical protein